ncbi:hypothetical protein [Profundibacter sp.]|uniref:hypothetical protein n=1 Tax=Profundibacter sp. TaxID=3101071 RepID=UPI003D0F78E6
MLRIMTLLIGLMFGFFLTSQQVIADVRLMMVEQDGCPWCERWKAEIGPIYPKTAEGRIAPLVKVKIHDPLEKGITLNSPPIYTPTFILLNDGQEVGRIEGYRSDEFFWWFMETMIKKLPEDLQRDPGA